MSKIKATIIWLLRNWEVVLLVSALTLVYLNIMREKEANQKALAAALATNKATLEAQNVELKKVEALIKKANEDRQERDVAIQKETEYHREVIVKEVQAKVKESNDKKPEDLAMDFAKSFGAEYVKIGEE